MLRVPKGGEVMVRDSIKDLQETLKDNMYEIENNYQRALDKIVDLEDERDNYKEERDKDREDKQEIVRRLEWVLGENLNDIENTIYDIINEFKEKY